MTVKRVTQRRTRLEKNFTDVFQDVVAGLNVTEIAAKYHVDHSAVVKFKQRNSEALEQAQTEVTDYSRNLAIADKANRIRELDQLYAGAREWLAENGFSERTVRYDKDGNQIGETIRFRADAVNALRALLREGAEQLGEIPRPDQNINVKAMLLLREISGTDTEVS